MVVVVVVVVVVVLVVVVIVVLVMVLVVDVVVVAGMQTPRSGLGVPLSPKHFLSFESRRVHTPVGVSYNQ